MRHFSHAQKFIQRIRSNAARADSLRGITQDEFIERYGLRRDVFSTALAKPYSLLRRHPLFFFVRLDRELRALVDPRWYRDAHLGSSRAQDPRDHFIETGLRRGLSPNAFVDLAPGESLAHVLVSRNPGEFDVGARFSIAGYLENHPDVARSGLNPLYHFMVYGRAEGRSPLAPAAPQSWEVRLVETLSPSGECSGFELHGFAVVDSLSAIEIVLDGELVGYARICIPSPESVRALEGASGLDGLFFKIDDISPLPDTPVLVRARELNGNTTEITTVFLNRRDHPDEEPELRFADNSWRLHGGGRSTGSGEQDGRRRLVVFTHDLGLGGGQLYLQEILRGLNGIPDLDVLVMSFAGGALVAELEGFGFTVRIDDGPNVDSGTLYEEFLERLNEQMLEFSPDYVLANTLGCFAHSDWASRVGIPQTWFVHESYTRAGWTRAAFGRPISPYVQHQLATALGNADSVVFEAQATLDLVMEGLDRTSAEFLRYGVEVPDDRALVAFNEGRARMRARFSITGERRVFIVVGTFEQRKAIGAVVRVAKVLKDRGAEADFILVGAVPGTAYTEQIHRSIKALGLTESVRVVNVTSDWLDYLQAADYFFLPSDLESMPQSMMMAMARGIPAIGANVFGVPELIMKGETGLLHEPNDIADMTLVLEGAVALSDEDLAGMGVRARSYIQRYHDHETYVRLVRERVLATLGETSEESLALDGAAGNNG